MPQRWGSATASTALAPMAASTAEPPRRSNAAPADEARWSAVHTSPAGACTVGVNGTVPIAAP